MKKLMDGEGEENSRKGRCNFKNRKTTLKKKASQLSKLCDVNVGMVCFGPDRTVETWPESKSQVCDIINRYRGLGHKDREKFDLVGFLGNKNKKMKKIKKPEDKSNDKTVIKNNMKILGQDKKRQLGCHVYSTWDERLDRFSEEDLVGLCGRVDCKLQVLTARIKLIKQEKSEKAVQVHNPSPLPLQFDGHCSYKQQVFSGPDFNLPGPDNFGIDYVCSAQPRNPQTLYQVLPIAMRPPLPFSDQSA